MELDFDVSKYFRKHSGNSNWLSVSGRKITASIKGKSLLITTLNPSLYILEQVSIPDTVLLTKTSTKENLLMFKYQNKEVLKDSAADDNKNRIVFHGDKSRYTTYTYDDKDNLTEENIYLNNYIYSQILYEYFDNKLIKKTQLSYDTKKKEYGTITEYFYLNDNLSEIKVETINIDINTKKIFTYNNLNQLISIKKLDYKKSDITNNIEKYSIETTIEYSTKKITIYHKNGYYVHYEFY